jgi:uncharacterized protein
MRLQSLAATNQARLLLGPPQVMRIEPPPFTPPIRMDDWRRSVAELLPAAERAITTSGNDIAEKFLRGPAMEYVPVPAEHCDACLNVDRHAQTS